MKRYLTIFLGLFLIAILGKAQAPEPTPEIKFISVYPQEVTAFSDSIIISIAYVDGDGDLGENEPSVRNLFLVDSRNGLEFEYRLQRLFAENEKATIKGKFNVVVDSPFLMDQSADSEEVVYTVYVKDRAGNESNRIETNPVKIRR